MIVKSIDVSKIRGNKDTILSKEKITGELEFVPMPNGTGLLMKPIEVLIKDNVEAVNRGRRETEPLSKIDIQRRGVLTLSRKESSAILTLRAEEKLTIYRKGWGESFKHIISR